MVIADGISATAPRDFRIEFFRGLALYMILVDHMIGDPLSMLTYRILGFSDATESFVFLSGLGAALHIRARSLAAASRV